MHAHDTCCCSDCSCRPCSAPLKPISLPLQPQTARHVPRTNAPHRHARRRPPCAATPSDPSLGNRPHPQSTGRPSREERAAHSAALPAAQEWWQASWWRLSWRPHGGHTRAVAGLVRAPTATPTASLPGLDPAAPGLLPAALLPRVIAGPRPCRSAALQPCCPAALLPRVIAGPRPCRSAGARTAATRGGSPPTSGPTPTRRSARAPWPPSRPRRATCRSSLQTRRRG